jgi:DNA-directed RNA polymerase specialized sigma24 family protein
LSPTQELFEALLDWLDPNRDSAGQRYEAIRAGLIRVFVSKGLNDAEHYTDEVIDRVMKRLPEIRTGYVGDPVRYFHGVARNVILEARRRKEIVTTVLPESVAFPSGPSPMSECLVKCLKLLPRDKRELILDYYLYDGHAKVEHHREMAGELSITEGALRTRVHHLRVSLEKCVSQCLATGAGVGDGVGHKKMIQSHKGSSGTRSIRHN